MSPSLLEGYLLVLLQIQEGDRVAEPGECVLRDDRNVVRPEVEVPEPVEPPEGEARDLVQIVVTHTQVLQVLCNHRNAQ